MVYMLEVRVPKKYICTKQQARQDNIGQYSIKKNMIRKGLTYKTSSE